jgi:hypothetical protein
MRWNGRAWKRVRSPSPEVSILQGVAAASARSAWAVGFYSAVTRPGPRKSTPLILRWNGRGWKRTPSPTRTAALQGVAATSAGNAWAVGDTGTITRPGGTLILHWSGRAWKRVPSPNTGSLEGVTATSSRNAWAVGGSLIVRWNGTSWKEVPSPPTNVLEGVAATSARNAWAVGVTGRTGNKTLILRWNGKSWK